MADSIYVWADFNALDGIHLPIDFKGSFSDIRRQNVELREGLHIIVYDDGCQADAIVEKAHGEWRARITSGISNVDSEPGKPGKRLSPTRLRLCSECGRPLPDWLLGDKCNFAHVVKATKSARF